MTTVLFAGKPAPTGRITLLWDDFGEMLLELFGFSEEFRRPESRFDYSSRRPSEGSTRAERRPARPDANTEAVTVSASATA
jgi:hypothetical protein